MLAKVISEGESVPNIKDLELTVTVDRHDPAPNVPGRFTEITKMDERDFKHLVKDIEDGYKDFKKEYFK